MSIFRWDETYIDGVDRNMDDIKRRLNKMDDRHVNSNLIK